MQLLGGTTGYSFSVVPTAFSRIMKRTVYLLQYMPGVVGVVGQAGFHIQGQAQNDIGFSMDGISAKSPYTGTVNQVDGVIQGSTDAMEEVKVLTTGVSAEYGHSAGGSMKMVYKSGTNQLHASFEDRYLNGKAVQGRMVLTLLKKRQFKNLKFLFRSNSLKELIDKDIFICKHRLARKGNYPLLLDVSNQIL